MKHTNCNSLVPRGFSKGFPVSKLALTMGVLFAVAISSLRAQLALPLYEAFNYPNNERLGTSGSSGTNWSISLNSTGTGSTATTHGHSIGRERMPSVRFGHVHVFNNYYDCFDNNYCVRTRINAEVLGENNYFVNVQDPGQRFVTSGSPGLLYASGNITNNCTFVNGWTSGAVVIPGNGVLGSDLNPPRYAYTLTPASDVAFYIQAYAGSGKYPYVQ